MPRSTPTEPPCGPDPPLFAAARAPGRPSGTSAETGFRSVGVLGTRFTMEGPIYHEALGTSGIDVVVPDADDAALVDRIIFEELVPGIVSAASRRAYQRVIDALRVRGCDAVALACTEIPLLIGPDDSSLPTLDSTRLLAAAALDRALTADGSRRRASRPPGS